MQGGMMIHDSLKTTEPGLILLELHIRLDWQFLATLPPDRRQALYEGIERIVSLATDARAKDTALATAAPVKEGE